MARSSWRSRPGSRSAPRSRPTPWPRPTPPSRTSATAASAAPPSSPRPSPPGPPAAATPPPSLCFVVHRTTKHKLGLARVGVLVVLVAAEDRGRVLAQLAGRGERLFAGGERFVAGRRQRLGRLAADD